MARQKSTDGCEAMFTPPAWVTTGTAAGKTKTRPSSADTRKVRSPAVPTLESLRGDGRAGPVMLRRCAARRCQHTASATWARPRQVLSRIEAALRRRSAMREPGDDRISAAAFAVRAASSRSEGPDRSTLCTACPIAAITHHAQRLAPASADRARQSRMVHPPGMADGVGVNTGFHADGKGNPSLSIPILKLLTAHRDWICLRVCPRRRTITASLDHPNPERSNVSSEKDGEPCRIRTCDPLIKSQKITPSEAPDLVTNPKTTTQKPLLLLAIGCM